jgi:hypothetical protein
MLPQFPGASIVSVESNEQLHKLHAARLRLAHLQDADAEGGAAKKNKGERAVVARLNNNVACLAQVTYAAYADVCGRMLTYAMRTYADAC